MEEELRNSVKSLFSDKLKSPSTLIKAISLCNPEIISKLNEYLNLHPEFEKISYLIISICKDIELHHCKTCGKIIPYSKRAHEYCSCTCTQKSNEVKQKIESTCLEKYGVKHPTESKEILEKRDENNLKKYGTVNLRSLKSINDKIKKTCLEKYGFETPTKNENVKRKSRQTCLEKYGVEFSGAAEIKKEKTKETFIKKYGGHPMQNETIKQSVIMHNREKYYNDLVERCRQFDIIHLFSLNDYIGGYRTDKKYKCHCNKCNSDFESYIEIIKIASNRIEYLPRCPNCYPAFPNISSGETEIYEYISSLLSNEQIIKNDRSVLNGKELDIYIPSKKIAFEFNGLYWHSFNRTHNKIYHQEKTLKCMEKGIRLIHIFEFDWMNKREIIKEKIKNILNLESSSIYARKCQIKEIKPKLKNEFLNQYHIQGEDKSSLNLGLFENNELIAVMTFGKPRFNKNYDWELIRYASSKRVIGGAGKLLKYFERNYNPRSLITYADLSYSNGNLYRQIGFKEIGISEPSYVYAKNNLIYSRFQCQKFKLKNLLSDKFDENLSEEENMKKSGFFKIYNCGNLIFEKVF